MLKPLNKLREYFKMVQYFERMCYNKKVNANIALNQLIKYYKIRKKTGERRKIKKNMINYIFYKTID